MLSIQQVIKALRKLQNTTHNSELFNNFKQQLAVTAVIKNSNSDQTTATSTLAAAGVESATATETIICESNFTNLAPTTTIVTSSQSEHAVTSPNKSLKQQQLQQQQQQQEREVAAAAINNSSQQQEPHDNVCETTKATTTSHHYYSQQHQQLNSLASHLNECGSTTQKILNNIIATCEATKTTTTTTPPPQQEIKINNSYLQQRSQQIQQFYQQQLHYFHTQHNQSLYAKQKQTTFAMSSLAAEPIALKKLQPQQQQDDINTANAVDDSHMNKDANASCSDNATTTPSSSSSSSSPGAAASSNKKPCFNTGLGEIIKFMELIGNLKHTKRTGWVLRDVNDCESISGHMYRMSMMTFLLDGSEGLNQIRCMELALVHDLAESLVGDITPFCGISKVDKRAMEFKAMDDICKLIEPRGKKIMELFEEYEEGDSAESKFVKDLDRLDMVMQAFEYEKRDKCLLKHQEFFDSTEGKFKHPFIKKLVNEIYEQREELARAEGATPPPYVHVPNMEDYNVAQAHDASTNGHHCAVAGATALLDPEQQPIRQQQQQLNHSDAAAKSTSSNSS